MLTAIMRTRREALVLQALSMFEVVQLYPELGEIVAAERYMMGLVHQVAPEDEVTSILLRVMEEAGLVVKQSYSPGRQHEGQKTGWAAREEGVESRTGCAVQGRSCQAREGEKYI